MKHIKIKSAAETAMRKTYAQATSEDPIVAEADHAALIADLIEKTRQMDKLKLAISEGTGRLMGYMQGHGALTDEHGKVLVTWLNGSPKQVVDYERLLTDLNVPPQKVAEYTTTEPGARTFTIRD